MDVSVQTDHFMDARDSLEWQDLTPLRILVQSRLERCNDPISQSLQLPNQPHPDTTKAWTCSKTRQQRPLHDVLTVQNQAIKGVEPEGLLSTYQIRAVLTCSCRLTAPVFGSTSMTNSPSSSVSVNGSSFLSQCGKWRSSTLKYHCRRSICPPDQLNVPSCKSYVRAKPPDSLSRHSSR